MISNAMVGVLDNRFRQLHRILVAH